MAKKISISIILAIFITTCFTFFGCVNDSNQKYKISSATVENGKITVSSASAKINEKITVTVTPNPGYGYKEGSLKYNGTPITDFTFRMPKKDVVLTAEFELKLVGKYNIIIDEMFNGKVTADRESGDAGITVNITVSPDTGYKIVTGSLKYNGIKIKDAKFAMPEEDVVIIADFELIEKSIYKRIDENGEESATGKYFLMGSYPQTIKADNVTVSAKTDSKGYYTGSDGEKYKKIAAVPSGTKYTFSNKKIIETNVEYYFKVEAIKWRLFSEDNGIGMLVAENIIDASQQYCSVLSDRNIGGVTYFPNDWSQSSIRRWLNGSFYGKAFHEGQQAIIKTTTLNNSKTAHLGLENKYAMNQVGTDDCVYLLSYKDIYNIDYGFSPNSSSDKMRARMTSDYSRARKAYMSTIDADDYGNGWWYLRSASSKEDGGRQLVSCVGNKGEIDIFGSAVNSSSRGIVPVINIKLA